MQSTRGISCFAPAWHWYVGATASRAEPIKITNIGHGYYSGALYVAVQEKLFQKHGLEPDVSFVQGGALALQAALTKQSDISILSYEHILTAGVQGRRVVAIYTVCNRPVNNVIANDKLAAGAEALSIEAKVKRLKGARVAMPSAAGSGEKMLTVLAKKYGLTLPGDITSVYLGAEAASYVAAFQRELIDAALPFEPAGVLVQQAGKGKILLNMMNGEIPEFRDILFIVLATHPDVDQGQAGNAAQGSRGVQRGGDDPQERSQARQDAHGQGISDHDAGDQRQGLRNRQPDLARQRPDHRGTGQGDVRVSATVRHGADRLPVDFHQSVPAEVTAGDRSPTGDVCMTVFSVGEAEDRADRGDVSAGL